MKCLMLCAIFLMSACGKPGAGGIGSPVVGAPTSTAPGAIVQPTPGGSTPSTPTANPAPSEYGGTEVGNGSDMVDQGDGAAWFLGREKMIHACMEMSADFGMNRSDALAEIRRAFEAWPTFFRDKNMFAKPTEKYDWSGSVHYKDDEVPAMHLNLTDAACTGTEDLKFYFGVSTPETGKGRLAFRNPLAFSRQTAYDLDKGWGRGYIWVRSAVAPVTTDSFPNWSRTGELNIILRHEIGHVFGNSHIPFTIMDADIGHQVQQLFTPQNDFEQQEKIKAALEGLDFNRSLNYCRECMENIEVPDMQDLLVSQRGFELLTGKRFKSVLPVTCNVSIHSFKRDFDLNCRVGDETHVWHVRDGGGDATDTDVFSLSATYRKNAVSGDQANVQSERGGSGFSYYAWIDVDKKHSYMVKVERTYGMHGFNRFSVHIHDEKEGELQLMDASEPVSGTFWIRPVNW